MNVRVLIIIVCVTLLHVCHSWSLFGKRAPPRKTQSLLEHLKRGQSRLKEDVSVISVTKNECGVQLDGTRRSTYFSKELAYVDRTEFVTPQCGLETTVGRAVEAHFGLHDDVQNIHGKALPSIYIAIFLSLTKREKITGGDFAPYLKTLPSTKALQHLPVFWSNRQLDELQNSVVKSAVKARRAEWKQEHDIVIDAIRETGGSPSNDFVDVETWLWARSIIASRSFTDDDALCLVPYVDMLNHINPGQANTRGDVMKCEWLIDTEGFHLVPPEKVVVNDKPKSIEISYGSHSNPNFLINYGFSVVDDEHQMQRDKATLSFALPEQGMQHVESLWEADGCGDCHAIRRNVTVSIGDVGPMNSALSLCRVASSKGNELIDMQDKFVAEGETTSHTRDGLVPQLGATLCRSPFSVMNEIRAMEMLQQVAMDDLGRYKTTLDEDEDFLWNRRRRLFGRANHNKVNAVIVRRSEKRILNHFFNLSTLALRLLTRTDIDFETYKGMLEATLEDEEPLLAATAS